MTTQRILTLIGSLLTLQALALFFGAEAISTEAFATLNPTETGIQIGAKMHEVVGVTNLTIGIILLASRDLPPQYGAKVLFGACVGLAAILGHGFYNLFATESKPPVPLLVLMTVLMVVGFVTANKASKAG